MNDRSLSLVACRRFFYPDTALCCVPVAGGRSVHTVQACPDVQICPVVRGVPYVPVFQTAQVVPDVPVRYRYLPACFHAARFVPDGSCYPDGFCNYYVVPVDYGSVPDIVGPVADPVVVAEMKATA